MSNREVKPKENFRSKGNPQIMKTDRSTKCPIELGLEVLPNGPGVTRY